MCVSVAQEGKKNMPEVEYDIQFNYTLNCQKFILNRFKPTLNHKFNDKNIRKKDANRL